MNGCSKPSSETDDSANTPDSNVVATVNGVIIDRDEMYQEMEQYVPAQLQGFPQNPLLGVSAGRVALQHLITDELAQQLAKDSGVPVTDDEVQSRYDDVKMVKESESTKGFEDLLNGQGMSVEQFKEESIKPDVAQYNIVGKGIAVPDQNLLQYYSAHLNEYTEPARIHIERIVLPDEASAQQAYQIASKSSSLDSVISENVAPPLTGGDNAADIAQWLDLDQTSTPLKAVLKAAENAPAGSVLPPINVQNQWWLVMVVDRKSKDVMPFDKVKHIVQWNVVTAKASAAGNFQKMESQMQDITQQAVINVIPPQYISLVRQLKNPPLFSSQGASATPNN